MRRKNQEWFCKGDSECYTLLSNRLKYNFCQKIKNFKWKANDHGWARLLTRISMFGNNNYSGLLTSWNSSKPLQNRSKALFLIIVERKGGWYISRAQINNTIWRRLVRELKKIQRVVQSQTTDKLTAIKKNKTKQEHFVKVILTVWVWNM